MKNRIILSLVIITIVAIGATSAFFSDTKVTPNALTASVFTAGTLKLDGTGFDSFNFGQIVLAPGEKTATKSIIIKNVGSMPLAWFGNLVIDGGPKLKEAIYIDSAKMEFLGSTDHPNNWDYTDTFITDGTGSGTNGTWYTSLANAATPFPVVSLKAFDGSSGMGTAPYEFEGALKPGYSYRLTLTFGFAEGADNNYQGNVVGGPINVSFRADATQINVTAIHSFVPTLNDISWLNAQTAKQTD